MGTNGLSETAALMVAPGKGILAADESTGTMNKRLEAAGADPSAESRREFRELLFTAEGMEDRISGVIMYDETLRQSTRAGTPFPDHLAARGVLPGIKVDTGAKPLAGVPGETVTEGLDGLRERLAEYRGLGARFAKWRAVIAVAGDLPSRRAIELNAHALARYAALCQEAGIVPIVEPEVLMDGDHPIERSEAVSARVLHEVFDALFEQRVSLEEVVLKPNMVLAGYSRPEQAPVEQVAERTLACLRRVVPAAVPGIAFLSGGQSDELATRHLDAMNRMGGRPWELTFSYGRALQRTPLELWGGRAENAVAAQRAFLERVRSNAAARDGRWSPAPERELVA